MGMYSTQLPHVRVVSTCLHCIQCIALSDLSSSIWNQLCFWSFCHVLYILSERSRLLARVHANFQFGASASRRPQDRLSSQVTPSVSDRKFHRNLNSTLFVRYG